MARNLLLGVLLCLVLVVVPCSGQTYTFGGSAALQVNATAGQKVTVTAAMSTNDLDEDGEGEALIVSLPGGPFTVSKYFVNQSTTFIALQDNPVVTAAIQGFDGDELARVTFIVQHNRFSDEQKAGFAKAAALYKKEALLEQTIAFTCLRIPIISKTCGVSQGGAILLSSLALRYDNLAKDPFDPDFTTVPQPAPPSFPTLSPDGDLTQQIADSYNAWELNQEQQMGFIVAINTAINRANSAEIAGDSASEQKQLTAAATYAVSLATLLNNEAGLRAQLQSAIVASGFISIGIAPADVFDEEINLLFFGFSADAVQQFQNAGFTSDDIAFMLGGLYAQDPNAVAPASFPELISDAELSSDNASLAADFVAFAISVGAGNPLASGSMVQTQGFVQNASGLKTTFAAEAHVDPHGVLHGSFTLHDQQTGLIIPEATVTSALVAGNLFTLTGNYTASDGSTGSFSVTANADTQAVSINTSTGFNASGPLGGGNVMVKN